MKNEPDEVEQGRGPGTSAQVTDLPLFLPTDAREAARDRRDKSHAEHRRLIIEAYRAYGPMTADDAGARVGLQPLQARPRVSELASARFGNQLRPTGRRGRSAYGNSAAILEATP